MRIFWHDEEGAVAASVAVAMLALVGTAMLTVDGGNLWSARRNIVTDTDAAALASARDLIDGNCTAADISDAQGIALQVLTQNDPLSVLTGPASIVCTTSAGRVAVSATRTTDLSFGGLAGIPNVDIASTSIAQYGQIASGEGLRPIAVCNKDPHFLEFARDRGYLDDQAIIAMLGGQDGIDLLALVNQVEVDASEHPTTGPDGSYPADNEVHRVYFSRVSVASDCGSSGGNWGWLDFDGGGGGAQQIRDWLRNGYDQPISVGVGENCAPEVNGETDCIGEPGAGGNSWNNALSDIYCPSTMPTAECVGARKAFPIILFDALRCTGPNPNNCGDGNGANARYDPDAFLGVILRDWSSVTGNPNSLSYFDFQFVDPFLTNGTIVGSPPGTGPGLIALQLCGGGFGNAIDDYCVVP